MINKEIIFEKLTPLENSDIGIYESAIDFAFEQRDIRNIAISGAYGAGKSSVLSAYKNKHNDKRFIHISLAHFQMQAVNSDEETSVKENGLIKESVLEAKILNQLIHQIPSDAIPQTGFKVKKAVSKRKTMIFTMFIAMCLITLFHILFFDSWNLLVLTLPDILRPLFSWSTTSMAKLGSILLFVGVSMFFLYSIVCTQTNRNIFRKLNIQGNEIEIFEDSEDSFFDKYLNEVLYLFENVDADVIVFEDMDRFDATGIFERLREINTLANAQRLKERKPILRFFYLLRDDIFISKDRTKFFDYIVPVIPVMDSSNSYDQFIAHLRKNNLLDRINGEFLQGLSLYVDDMRLLKNICNEFLVYYNRLGLAELDCNKMLAIITYKNLFPKDFSELQLNKGFVYTLFESKNKLIEAQVRKLQAKINLIDERLKSAHHEVTVSHEELDLIFKSHRDPWYNNIRPEYQAEYERRNQAIDDNASDEIEKLEKTSREYSERIHALSNASLSAILTRDNIDCTFRELSSTNELGENNEYEEIKKSEYFDLLKYLIRNGYIDETYADYMTYFYENSLSRIDKLFLLSVFNKKAKAFDYALKSPSMVLRRLHANNFDQEETLNLMLCDELLRDDDYKEHLWHLIEQIKNHREYSFLSQLFDYCHAPERLVCAINSQWHSIFSDIQKSKEFSKKQVREYSILTMCCSSESVLESINCASNIAVYISEQADYLNIANPDVNKLVQSFKLLNVSFLSVDYNKANKELFMAVYENDLYELNISNIVTLLKNCFGTDNVDRIRHKSYSIICTDIDSPIYKRINKNFQAYLDVVFDECQDLITDDEKYAIEILNRDDIDAAHKTQYIDYLQTPISRISAINDQSIWEPLMHAKILSYNEQNIVDYLVFKRKPDSALVEFINGSEVDFDFSPENIALTESVQIKLFDSFITCNELSDRHYNSIMGSIGIKKPDFNILGIDKSKVSILIDNDIVIMDLVSLSFFRNEYPTALYEFIKRNICEYTNISRQSFSYDELCEILNWDIDDSIKLELLELCGSPVSILDKNISLSVRVYILENNIEQSDMQYLYLNYSDEPKEIKDIILTNASFRINQIINAPESISFQLARDILCSNQVNYSNKIKIVESRIPNADKDEVCKYLSALELGEFIKIFDSRSKPKFENTDDNVRLLNAFQKKEWIHDYVIDDTRNGYYKIRRHAPKKALTTKSR